jgi:hemolysin activation/secretion protein
MNRFLLARIAPPRFSLLPNMALLLGLPWGHLAAQPLPDAGTLLRESERSLQAPLTTPHQPTAPSTRPMAQDAKALRVQVHSIRIDGASLLSTAELQALVADRIGQSLTLGELEQAAQRLAEHYRAHGWYARVYLPQQDVTKGAIRIQVLEGRYGGSSAQGSAQRADAQAVQQTITQRLQPGQPLSAADLERGLLLANDLPGIAATGLLQPGAAQGETQLAINVQDTPFVSGDIGLNNHGVRATGRTQAVGGLALNNLSGSGDQLALRLLAAQDIASAQLRYSLPLGRDGLRLALHAATLHYRLGSNYQVLEAKGKAQTAGLGLTYPLLRQSDRNLQLSAGYEQRRYQDDMLGQALSHNRIQAGTLGINGDLRDTLGGGGINWGSVQLTHGSLDIHDVAGAQALDAAGPRSAGDYTKLMLQLARSQHLAMGWQLQASLSGQWASGNLGSSERFSLGGPNQVRAYPVNEASGDQGLLLKLELQRELGSGWQAVAFYDVGQIQQHRHSWAGWQGGGNQPNRYHLAGAGLGVNWRHQGWLLSASVASPIGSNPAAMQGLNNDGSSSHSIRGWISLGKTF